MSFSDDILMAYADGELDQATRLALEAAMRRDAVLARRVAQYQARRRMAAPRRAATVVQLADVRATRAATQQAARKARKLRWSWMEWGALAGVLVLGLAAGRYLLGDWQADQQSPASLAWRDGALVAQGRLALALDQAPGGTAGVYGGGVRIAASFVATDGGYCRSFTASGGAQDMAGLACRSGGVWKLPVWQQVARPAGGARPAGVDVPAAVQAVVEQRSAGQLLDAAAEQDAMRRGWVR
ncbi:hypothetical protein [Pseudoduganella namucuonensis]|uniref:Anti-sigma factor n=1 Tax=Pseudoduganella namucuonensis TaxID=1035707 RepID=A0A1I7LM62_9BURK|nr:hypothetical protein [Pseudoduganella namucuonensis]SFV10816.1 hypothetical protein SAMN05216552_103259 [Pseudoduganella namucuonensis]